MRATLRRLVGVEPHVVLPGIQLLHGAKSAAARAAFAQNHEGGRAAMEALVDVRAARRFAHRVQLQLAQSALQVIQRFEMRPAPPRPLGQARTLGRGRRCAANLNQRINHACTAPGWKPAVSRSVLARPKEGVSLYGPTSTRVRLFGPGVRDRGKALVLQRVSASPRRLPASRRSPARTIPAAVRTTRRRRVVGRRRGGLLGCGRLRRPGLRAAWWAAAPPPAGGLPAAASGAGGADDTGTGAGDAGCGRESAAVFAALLAGPLPTPAWPDAGEFCPTTYPIAKATANSSTTMKKPLSSCLLPTTSSNSPVSLFLMF